MCKLNDCVKKRYYSKIFSKEEGGDLRNGEEEKELNLEPLRPKASTFAIKRFLKISSQN